MRAQRQHIGDVLVRANHHQSALLAVDATQVEDVLSALEVRAEDFLMVDQSATPLAGPQQRGQGLDRQCAMPLLEHAPQIEDRVDVLARRQVCTGAAVTRWRPPENGTARSSPSPQRRPRRQRRTSANGHRPCRRARVEPAGHRRCAAPAPNGSACRSRNQWPALGAWRLRRSAKGGIARPCRR